MADNQHNLRSRKPVTPAVPQKQELEEDTSKSKPIKKRDEGPDLEPNFFVAFGLFLAFAAFLGTIFFYKVDNAKNGDFASWVNTNFPTIDRTLNRRSSSAPLFGAAAETTAGLLKLTEEELKKYDGTNDNPIYLAIDGTIFDVSVSPAFYGPGGHYHHFVGKDATRAWVTECWDEEDQFTWRMDDVEVMFMNKYLDETLESAGKGDFEGMGDVGESVQQMMGDMAKKAMEKLGSVTDGEKKKRRKVDEKEAKEKVTETLEHWKKFFAGNEKYKVVGEVILDESRPAPPKPCKKAMEKRPLKGGRLEGMMGGAANLMGGGAGKAKGNAAAEMPDFVKAMQKDKKAKEAKEKAKKEPEAVELKDEDEAYHEEL